MISPRGGGRSERRADGSCDMPAGTLRSRPSARKGYATPAEDKRMIRAVLFDLGDTLVHQETSQLREYVDAGTRTVYERLLELGFDRPEYTVYLRKIKRRFVRAVAWSRITRREAQLVEAFRSCHAAMGMEVDREQMTDLVLRCIAPLRQFFMVDGDAVPVVAELSRSGYKLGLVSNTLFPGFAIDDVLQYDGLLEWLPVRVYSSDVRYMKPHRRIFEEALGRLGVASHEAVFVGDRIDKDVKGASRVGMRTVLLARNGQVPRSSVRPDHIVRRLSEVPAVLKS